MSVDSLVVADPVQDVGDRIAKSCSRIARHCVATTTGAETIAAIKQHQPQIVLLSLEIRNPEAIEVAQAIKKQAPKCYVIGTYRELAVPTIELLRPRGVDEFVAQPVERSEMFEIIAKHFNIQTRHMPRHEKAIDVYRADGVLVGKTRNISAKGMLLHTVHPAALNQSLLVDLALPDQEYFLRTRCRIVEVDGKPPKATLARALFEGLHGPAHERLMNFVNALEAGTEPAS
jgi:DNA-binding NtrC family response regulator